MQRVFVPILLIVLAIPLILQRIPRNGFYGFRTPYTLSSDDVWFRANKIAGITLLVAGIFWLGLSIWLPRVMTSQQEAASLVNWYGLTALGLSVAVSFWLTYRTR
jgi:uncharacterized membrane protein